MLMVIGKTMAVVEVFIGVKCQIPTQLLTKIVTHTWSCDQGPKDLWFSTLERPI